MTTARNPRILQMIPALFAACLFTYPVQAKYSGGSGTADDPYQITTAADLITVGANLKDYDKHFILTADIDLDPNLPDRPVFDKAPIASDVDDAKRRFQGTAFTGLFEGSGHTIRHLTIAGAGYLGLFGQLGAGARVKNLELVDVNVSGSEDYVGGLAGHNEGHVVWCSCSGTVRGRNSVGGLIGANRGDVMQIHSCGTCAGERQVGGLLGANWGKAIWCHSSGTVRGQAAVGGLAGYNSGVVMHCYSAGPTDGTDSVGGLVGDSYGDIDRCYSRSTLSGITGAGGLVGTTGGTVRDCYATGTVTAGDGSVGGLVGINWGTIATSYSAGMVGGTGDVGGLVGCSPGTVTRCFWDIQRSGQAGSSAGTGLTTTQMQTAATFLSAGWDFTGEAANGIEDWWTIKGLDYPKLVRQFAAFWPTPQDGATDVIDPVILRWIPGASARYHDIYWGNDREVVANATVESPGVYRGRQPAEATTYEPARPEYGKPYYWRIDEVNEADPNNLWKGRVWSFTTADYIVVDDFESYNDDDNPIWNTWADGYNIPENGAMVGCLWPVGPCVFIAHTGRQSMQFYYENTGSASHSEAVRTWVTPQDRTVCEMDTLTLYVHGRAKNEPDCLYVALEDSDGCIAVVVNPDPNAVLIEEWTEWNIPLSDFTCVNPTTIVRVYVGVGDPDKPAVGREGFIHIDDIRVTRAPAPPALNVAVVDDFESYNDIDPADPQSNWIFETWITWAPPVNGAMVGHVVPPFAETNIVHGGSQSMPLYYDNTDGVVNSRAQRSFFPAQDWTVRGANMLSLWFRGTADNGIDVFYLEVWDSANNSKTLLNSDPNAVVVATWTPWFIPLSDLTAAGINTKSVRTLQIGVGDETRPSQNARGILYIDDISVMR